MTNPFEGRDIDDILADAYIGPGEPRSPEEVQASLDRIARDAAELLAEPAVEGDDVQDRLRQARMRMREKRDG